MRPGCLRILHKSHEGVNGRAGYRHDEPGKIAENHPLALGKFCAQKRPENVFIERDCAVDKLFSFHWVVVLQAVKAKIEKVQSWRVFDVIGVNKDKPVCKAFRVYG